MVHPVSSPIGCVMIQSLPARAGRLYAPRRSSSDRGLVDRTSWPGHRGKSWATPEETGSRPARAGKDRIITHPIGDETGWTTARSLGEVGTTSVHSKPVCLCSDCTFLDEIHRAALKKKMFSGTIQVERERSASTTATCPASLARQRSRADRSRLQYRTRERIGILKDTCANF